MQTIDDYMDAARRKAGVPSDLQLAKALGKSPSVATQWRTRRSWPSDETMLKLAELAGADPTQALLDLNTWRSQSPAVRDLYSRIAETIKAAARPAATTAIILGALLVSDPAEARTNPAQSATVLSQSIHYAICSRAARSSRQRLTAPPDPAAARRHGARPAGVVPVLAA